MALIKCALLFFFIVFVTCQICSASPRVARDTDAATKPSSDLAKSLDETLSAIKTGFDGAIKTVQGNEFYQSIASNAQKLGQSIQEQGQQLVDSIKKRVNTD